MRDQYAGDISDLLKFAFLRALAESDRLLGVAWYYDAGHEGGSDGRHLEWRGEPAWQKLDADLHRALSALPEQSIAALEQLVIWPQGTLFHREPITHGAHRRTWADNKRSILRGANLVFLDPDNGLSGPAKKQSKKHATVEEIAALRQPHRALVFITFPDRSKPHLNQEADLHERLHVEAQVRSATTLRISVSVLTETGSRIPRTRWFTVVDLDRPLIDRAISFKSQLSSIPYVKVYLEFFEDGLLTKDDKGSLLQ